MLLDKSEIGPDLGYLPQDIELFNGTVAENVARFGELDSDNIVSACQITGVHDLILSLPQGYETVIGDRGVTLSAGQRQRLGLARAVYGDPRLVVLDEPNSNLDVAGEQALHQTIANLKSKGVTIIVIAHRSSILSALDRLLVMNSGAIEKYGTMQEVMGRPVRPVQGVAS
jgi:ATP-binding cassette subfamily C protein EexD